MMEEYYEEECPNCDDCIVKIHKIIVEEGVLQCLECGHKQKYASF